MRKEDKEYLRNNELTESMILSCLVTCEKVIGTCAYNEKRFARASSPIYSEMNKGERLIWSGYRTQLREVLHLKYSIPTINQMISDGKNKASKEEVKTVIELLNEHNYRWIS